LFLHDIAFFVRLDENGSVMKKYTILVFAVIALLLPVVTRAFEPEIISFRVQQNVKYPDSAIGYFTELMGDHSRFVVDMGGTEDFDLALWIPDVTGATKDIDISVSYINENQHIIDENLTIPEDEWVLYTDEFTGNRYYKGPELHAKVSTGTPEIMISTKSNENDFLLILGHDIEKQTISWDNMIAWGSIKNDVYAEFPLTAYYNIYGVLILIPTIIVVALIILIGVKEYLRIKKQDEAEDSKEDEKIELSE
jgi:hypothetical protein